MACNKFGYWISKCTYFSLEDALSQHRNIIIEDITKDISKDSHE